MLDELKTDQIVLTFIYMVPIGIPIDNELCYIKQEIIIKFIIITTYNHV